MPGSKHTKNSTAVYVYGIVPADVEIMAEARGVGDPPAEVALVRSGGVAAMVSEVPRDHALGTPEDLRAHAQLLNDASKHSPVLPLRFGAVVSDADSVAEDLLKAHRAEFQKALKQLEGRAQYVVKGRYVEKAMIGEILEQNAKAAELREKIRGQSENASRQYRIALGELINTEISRKRQQSTQHVADVLKSLGFEVNLRPATHELDAFQVACLAETSRQGELEDAVAQLAGESQGYVEVRLLGPIAPYDFVTTTNRKP